jgi:hypothetical protein
MAVFKGARGMENTEKHLVFNGKRTPIASWHAPCFGLQRVTNSLSKGLKNEN